MRKTGAILLGALAIYSFVAGVRFFLEIFDSTSDGTAAQWLIVTALFLGFGGVCASVAIRLFQRT